MSNIKIDRGFTQKIHQKDLAHTPAPDEKPHQPQHTKKSKRRSKGRFLALAVGAGALGLTVVVVLALSGGGTNKPKPKTASDAPTTLVATKVLPQDVSPDFDEAPSTKQSERPASQTLPPPAQPAQPSSQPKPATSPLKPVNREIPLGSPEGLLCDYYENLPGKLIGALRSASAFPEQPSRTVQIGNFELSENQADNYGARVRGFLVPPQSGAYTFSVCGDDAVELWLSTDDKPAHLRKLVSYGTWIAKYGWTNRTEQQSMPCDLVGGQRYYLEGLVKESTGGDFLMVAWRGPVSDKYAVIEQRYLQPWTDASAKADAAAALKKARHERESACAPARMAVEEQQQKNGDAYRYAEVAAALKRGKSAWQNPAALEHIENAIQRFELLGKLRAFVQAELAREPVRKIWTAFGGQADVTGASDEGVTVAPGRIVEWSKIPPSQLLRLVNATVPKATGDAGTKSVLLLASAVFCKEVSGGLDLALKYRERAVTLDASLSDLAERVLGGTPDSILAQDRIQASRPELARLANQATGLAAKARQRKAELEAYTGLVPGLNAEYWAEMKYSSLTDACKQGALNKPPTAFKRLESFATPENWGESFIARVRGYLVPGVTGEYTFYIAADDQGEFWLSSDETPACLALCVKTESYSALRGWDKDKRKSRSFPLEKGKHYFVEALLREGAKNDHLAVAWSLTDEDTPKLITSEYLLFAATEGFTPHAQDVRKQLEADLSRIQTLTAQVGQLRDADAALADVPGRVTPEMASEQQQQISRAKELLRDAELASQQFETALQQFKASIKPEGAKP